MSSHVFNLGLRFFVRVGDFIEIGAHNDPSKTLFVLDYLQWTKLFSKQTEFEEILRDKTKNITFTRTFQIDPYFSICLDRHYKALYSTFLFVDSRTCNTLVLSFKEMSRFVNYFQGINTIVESW